MRESVKTSKTKVLGLAGKLILGIGGAVGLGGSVGCVGLADMTDPSEAVKYPARALGTLLGTNRVDESTTYGWVEYNGTKTWMLTKTESKTGRVLRREEVSPPGWMPEWYEDWLRKNGVDPERIRRGY
ncbi:hypothetical protein COU61_00475 [Candidatus Pacearchaeota archaeon CG10_big_fil_rev_8_21_14_0_10_35_13]|nr:MAG: hypothetical protein COU61_00475 [Candidatus Pacearchaeota archaeon CG10_big_fil_rev_8_21_14_0_10_35_13]